jgi:hypothetical protein
VSHAGNRAIAEHRHLAVRHSCKNADAPAFPGFALANPNERAHRSRDGTIPKGWALAYRMTG